MLKYKEAVVDVSEVMKFENWLRFYFIKEEEGDALRIEIPEENMEKIKADYAHLADLAEQYNGDLIDYKKSCDLTCAHVSLKYEGSKYPGQTVADTFDSKELKIEMYLFGMWMQGSEDQLDEEFMEFTEWIEGYESWKSMPEVQDYLARLTDVGQNGPQ